MARCTQNRSSKSKMQAQKLTSILLCALVASTLGHDVLRAKHFAEEVKASKVISPFEDRAASEPQECVYICTSPDGSQQTEFELYINATTNLIGVVNVTAKIAFIYDVTANIIALLDGNNGASIVINLTTQKGYYIAAGQSDKTWKADKVTFEVYFSALLNLKILLNIGTEFTVQTCPNNILIVINGLLVHLSAGLTIQIGANLKVGLEILIKIGSRLSVLLNGSLKGFLQLAGKGAIRLYGDIAWLVIVLEGLGEFLGHISGGLGALIKAKVNFDLRILLGAASGIEILVNLVFAISARLGVSVIANLLNNVEILLELLVKLGGGVGSGITGILKVVVLVLKLSNKSIKLDALIDGLLEFALHKAKNPRAEIDIAVEIEGLVQLVQVIKSSGSGSADLKVFIDFVAKLQSGNLVIRGINISNIIKLLAGAVENVLELVVSLLILLDTVVTIYVSIPWLLLALLRSITTAAGVRLLIALGIIVESNLVGNLVAGILKSVNLTTIIRLIATGFNLDTVLRSIPIVKDIYASLSAAVKASSKGSLSVSVIVTSSSSSSVTTEIKAWVKTTLNVGGSIGGGGGVTATTKSSGGIIDGVLGGLGGIFG